jgi:hypothetical protein
VKRATIRLLVTGSEGVSRFMTRRNEDGHGVMRMQLTCHPGVWDSMALVAEVHQAFLPSKRYRVIILVFCLVHGVMLQ